MTRNLNLSKGNNAEVLGLDELVKNIEDLKDKVSGDELRSVLMTGAQVIKEEARRRAPVKTGRLRDSIIATYGDSKQTDKNGNITVAVMTKTGPKGAPHAWLVENGSSTAPAHPYMRPAVAAKRNEATEQIADGLKKLIEGKEQA